MNNLTNISTINKLLNRHGFRFSKSLGQNFLINPSICPRMAEACGADKGTGVLEIGPGIGVLTHELAKRSPHVVSVEIDKRLLPILNETLSDYKNVKIIHADALKIDLSDLIKQEFSGMRVSICANLPYYITSPMLMRLLESRLSVDSITVMVQKEAALRLCAKPGTRQCGAVTLAVWYYAIPEMLFQVSRGSFIPSPNVDSAVIRLNIRKKPACLVKNEKTLFRITRAAFGQRRKTLSNALTSAGLTKEQVKKLLEAAGISNKSRAEELTLDQFASLSNIADSMY